MRHTEGRAQGQTRGVGPLRPYPLEHLLLAGIADGGPPLWQEWTKWVDGPGERYRAFAELPRLRAGDRVHVEARSDSDLAIVGRICTRDGLPWLVGLDTGCVWGRTLTLLRLDDGAKFCLNCAT